MDTVWMDAFVSPVMTERFIHYISHTLPVYETVNAEKSDPEKRKCMTTKPEGTLTDPLEVRRKRLMFRANYRGMKELDLVIGAFSEAFVPSFDADSLREFEAILDVPDSDLLDWLTLKSEVPAAMNTSVMQTLMNFDYVKTLR
jgi:antitoxin CptB